MSDQNDVPTVTGEKSPGSDGQYDRRLAVERLLREDDSLTGRIYQYGLDGKSPAEIAEAEGNKGAAFVYNYRLQIDALLKWEVPTSPWAGSSAAGRRRRCGR